MKPTTQKMRRAGDGSGNALEQPLSPLKAAWLSICALPQMYRTLRTKGLDFDGVYKLAFYDPLTALKNKTSYHGDLRSSVKEAMDNPGSKTLVVMRGDLDGFKAINDTYGHAAGDDILAAVGYLMANHFRTNDMRYMVSKEDAHDPYRAGGDELAFIGLADNPRGIIKRCMALQREIPRKISVSTVDKAEAGVHPSNPANVGLSYGFAILDDHFVREKFKLRSLDDLRTAVKNGRVTYDKIADALDKEADSRAYENKFRIRTPDEPESRSAKLSAALPTPAAHQP
jgi:diguanylate cyclase (GGDEF)-like protein